MSLAEETSEEEKDFMGFSPMKNQTGEKERENAIDLAKQLHVYKPGIEFVVGAKLEVLDIRDNKWYSCKVLEVDWGELDIHVHYERWSTRFDEWMKMDSNRIRKASVPTKENTKLFKVGDKILGFWAPDGRHYPATIVKHVSEDTWSVKFMDGISKSLRTSQLKKPESKEEFHLFEVPPTILPHKVKVEPKELGEKLPSPAQVKLEPGVEHSKRGNIFNVEILDEKRKTKRKPELEKLFQSLKKRRKNEREDSDDEVETKSNIRKLKTPVKTERKSDQGVQSTETSPDRLTLHLGAAGIKLDQDSSVSSAASTPLKANVDPKIKEELDSSYDDREDSDVSSKFEGFQESPSSRKRHPSSVSSSPFKGFNPSPKKLTLSDREMSTPTKQEELLFCSEEGCDKTFRNQALRHMHVRHYHPESLKNTDIPPLKVVDLAKARTADEQLSPPIEVEKKPKERRRTISKTRKDSKTEPFDSDWDESDSVWHRTDVSAAESDQEVVRKKKHDKRVQELKGKKTRKSMPSESMSEDDPIEMHVTRGRGYRRKARLATPKLGAIAQEAGTLQSTGDPNAIINCGCGVREEDGLMLQCDICLCWQHGSCYGIESDGQVPDKYICQICDHSRGQRRSSRFRHHQEYLKEGKLPRFSFATDDGKRLEGFIRRGHNLLGNVLQVSQGLHSLQVKINVAQQDDHPKLFLWHKPWQEPEDEFAPKKATTDLVVEPTAVPDSAAPTSSMFMPTIDPTICPVPPSSQIPVEMSPIVAPVDTKESVEPVVPPPMSANCSSTATPGDTSLVSNSSLHLQLSPDANKSFGTPESTTTGRDSLLEPIAEPLEETSVTPSVENPRIPSEDAIDESTKKQVLDSKENLDDFVFNLGGLGVAGPDPPVFGELSSNDELERLVQQATTELSAHFQAPPQQAPIIPETERIQPLKCKLNLISHIDQQQDRLANQLSYIETHLQALEAEMGLTSEFTAEEEEMLSDEVSEMRDPVTLQARSLVQMLLKDLDTVQQMVEYIPPKKQELPTMANSSK